MDKKQQETVNRLLQAAEGLTLDQIRGVSNEKLDFIVFSLIGEKTEIYVHAQCPVRMTGGGKALLAINDLYLPREGVTEEQLEEDPEGNSLFDEHADALEQAGLKVQDASVTLEGEMHIDFQTGQRLRVYPYCSNQNEEWRVILARDGRRTHIVYLGDGETDVETKRE